MRILWGFFLAFLLAFLSMYCDEGGCVSPWYDPGETVKCGPPIIEDGGEDQGQIAGRPVVLRPSVRLPPEHMALCQLDLITLTYSWEQVAGPAQVVLEGVEYKQPSFIPPRAGEYIFRCRARYPRCESEKKCFSEWTTLQVQVGELVEIRDCAAPLADAGQDQVLAAPAVAVILDGGASRTDAAWGCEGIAISAYSWSVASQPAGSDVALQRADQAMATVDLSIPGLYEFQLVVEDSTGRTGTDYVRVEIAERPSCEDSLMVRVVPTQSGIQVTVVDSAGAFHHALTNASGEASFSGLAPGRRNSITARETGDNPIFEMTSVLDHCSDRITVPMRRTADGRVAESGTIVGRVPNRLFDSLPEPPLPFMVARLCWFGCPSRPLYEYSASGQIRTAFLIPVLGDESIESFSVNDLLAPPFEEGAVFPGNMAADDTFTLQIGDSSIGSPSGLSHYGEKCTSAGDCPDEDIHCVLTGDGDYRCRDFAPMRNVKMEIPAGDGVRLALVLGLADLSFTESPTVVDLLNRQMFYSPGEDVPGLGGVEVFKYRALHVCPFAVDVAAGSQTDITAALAAIDLEECFNIDYKTQEVVEPFYSLDDFDPANLCESDGDCDWPDSGRRCLKDPADAQNRYCFYIGYRQRIVSDNKVIVRVDPGGFSPASLSADERLRSWLPSYAPYEVLCNEDGRIQSCTPPQMEELWVPEDVEYRWRYGLALAALDFPVGHGLLPEGGRMVVGLDFNHTEHSTESESGLFVPAVEGASVTAAQFFMRNIDVAPMNEYRVVPGRFGTSTTSRSNKGLVILPAFAQPPSADWPDAGLEVEVTFVPEDPTRWPHPVILRVYSAAVGMLTPQAGIHDLPTELSGLGATGGDLMTLVVARVDRTDAWRLYAPSGTDRIVLPPSLNPFSSGDEILLTLQGQDFQVPFDYDLFPPDLLQRGPAAFSRDSYALVVP
jgi:hypothetical protein